MKLCFCPRDCFLVGWPRQYTGSNIVPACYPLRQRLLILRLLHADVADAGFGVNSVVLDFDPIRIVAAIAQVAVCCIVDAHVVSKGVRRIFGWGAARSARVVVKASVDVEVNVVPVTVVVACKVGF